MEPLARIPRLLRTRQISLAFDQTIPRHWFHGDPLGTHLINGLNLLFPVGERAFIRSVNRFLPRMEDDRLRAAIGGFFAQEAMHAAQHERYFEVLRAQGYRIDRFLGWFRRMTGVVERILPDRLLLAQTAALEHFTAMLGERVLTDPMFDDIHPVMRDLLRWHGAEELEHKAVAFDALRQISSSYLLRITGMITGGALLIGYWTVATTMLLRQDRLRLRQILRGARERQWRRNLGRDLFWKGALLYMRRDFHPDQQDNLHLARDYMARAFGETG